MKRGICSNSCMTQETDHEDTHNQDSMSKGMCHLISKMIKEDTGTEFKLDVCQPYRHFQQNLQHTYKHVSASMQPACMHKHMCRCMKDTRILLVAQLHLTNRETDKHG